MVLADHQVRSSERCVMYLVVLLFLNGFGANAHAQNKHAVTLDDAP